MIRSALFAMAVAAMVFSVNAALAGGGGGSKSNNQYVRIKNTGSGTVLVNAANGSVSAAGAKSLASNGVAQFNLKKSASQAISLYPADTTVQQTLPYSFPRNNYVYLLAAADATTATMTFSPPGKTF